MDLTKIQPYGSHLAALMALFLGVFGGWIRRWVVRPELRFAVSGGPPDCHMTRIVASRRRPSLGIVEVMAEAACYYLRLRIHNFGRSSAKDVEVVLTEVARLEGDGQFHAWAEFLPLNLLWAHTGKIVSPRIPPGGDMPRYCDVGRIVDPAHRRAFGDDHARIADVPEGEAVLALDLSVKANTGTFLLTRGVYRLTVAVAASNASVERREVRLAITGRWSEDEATMRQEVSIRLM